MIAFLTKSDASEGFDQIVYFLTAHPIQYALIVNPTIYVSCIKKFWASVLIKKSNDAVKLQALIDRKKVIITEDTIRQNLRLDDANGIDCLPNEEIFAELARMGYEKPSTKLTFYKAFFSAQWKKKVIITEDTIRQNLRLDDANGIDCLPNEEIFAELARMGYEKPGLPGMNIVLPWPRLSSALQQVESSIFPKPIPSPSQAESAQPSSPPQQQPSQHAEILESTMTLLNTLMETCATLTKKVANLEQDKIAQALEIVKLKQRVRKLEKKRRTKHSSLKRLRKVGGKIATLDADEDVTIVDVDEIDADIQERMAESQAKNDVIDQVKRKENQDNKAMRYQTLKRKPVTKAQARKNMMIYLKNMAGFKMDFFKGMTYNEIRPIFEKHYNSIQAFLERVEEEVIVPEEESKRKGKSLEQEITKKHRIDEEAKELKTHLQIVANDDDDVFTKATPLATKVHVVDYQIHHENNKPYYKIIRADGTHNSASNCLAKASSCLIYAFLFKGLGSSMSIPLPLSLDLSSEYTITNVAAVSLGSCMTTPLLFLRALGFGT
nr:hypothetical protein [Tanacetum cinerariifolium]